MPKIAFIMGKSSSGKDKIFKALAGDSALALKTIVLYTTRPMRSGERQGVEYNFVSNDEADAMCAEGRIIELRSYNTVQGVWRYFTADDGQIDIVNGRYVMIGTLDAYRRFCEYFGKEEMMPIYIEVEDRIRMERAMRREAKQAEPDYAELCRRFLADCADFSEDNIKNCGISKRYYNNENIEDCINEIKSDIIRYML